jgi:hypothetical protein
LFTTKNCWEVATKTRNQFTLNNLKCYKSVTHGLSSSYSQSSKALFEVISEGFWQFRGGISDADAASKAGSSRL